MDFIVMEYVVGVSLHTLDVLNNPHLAKRTMDAIQHLAAIPIPPIKGLVQLAVDPHKATCGQTTELGVLLRPSKI